jgi:hypothetical protein
MVNAIDIEDNNIYNLDLKQNTKILNLRTKDKTKGHNTEDEVYEINMTGLQSGEFQVKVRTQRRVKTQNEDREITLKPVQHTDGTSWLTEVEKLKEDLSSIGWYMDNI